MGSSQSSSNAVNDSRENDFLNSEEYPCDKKLKHKNIWKKKIFLKKKLFQV